jgi:AraC-like DNA-binding protein
MYDQLREDTLYMMVYAGVMVMAMMSSCYLLFRRGNAIAPDVTPPARLRHWTAIFFASIVLCHFWYLPTYFLTSSDDVMQGNLIAGLLDCMTIIPLMIVVLLTMLQDRRRPLWPVAVMVAPLVAGFAWCIASRSEDLLQVLFVYFLLMCFGFIIYMIRAIRQYRRWLCDNYADLEHKEVWQSFVVLGFFLLVYVVYLLDVGELIYEYAMEVILVVLICYLLWRVETLSDLSLPVNDAEEETGLTGDVEDNDFPLAIRNKIRLLLQQHCIDEQLYLQHDLTLLQLAKAIGTNRSYLSQYFSCQGTTYNAYINDLRIKHFVSLYHEAVAAQHPFTAQQLAQKSGFRNYNTFGAAFKKAMGMNTTEWMRNLAE